MWKIGVSIFSKNLPVYIPQTTPFREGVICQYFKYENFIQIQFDPNTFTTIVALKPPPP